MLDLYKISGISSHSSVSESEESLMSPLDCECTTISRELFPFLSSWEVYYLLTAEERRARQILPILGEEEKYIEVWVDEIERFVPK